MFEIRQDEIASTEGAARYARSFTSRCASRWPIPPSTVSSTATTSIRRWADLLAPCGRGLARCGSRRGTVRGLRGRISYRSSPGASPQTRMTTVRMPTPAPGHRGGISARRPGQRRSRQPRTTAGLHARLPRALGDQVTHELLQAQVEVGTASAATSAPPAPSCSGCGAPWPRLRGEHGMAIDRRIDPSHRAPGRPAQHRQAALPDAHRRLPVLARRQVISGMHIHAEIEDEDLRIDLMNQVTYFLPHLLALSTSSPFWNGARHRPQGLSGRAVADDLPRSGSPEHLESWRDWQRSGRDAGGDRPGARTRPRSGGTSALRPSIRRWS